MRLVLVDALLIIVKKYHKPVIGELVSPAPSGIMLDPIEKKNIGEVLNSLVAQCPGYVWFEKSGVIVFGNEKLLSAPGNPMNKRGWDYTIPDSLSDFKSTFPNAVNSEKHPDSGIGGIGSGIVLPNDLSPKLTIEEVKNIEARQILIKVAAQVGQFFSAIILPSIDSPVKDDSGTDFLAWDIVGGPGIVKYKSYLSNIP